MNVSFEVSESSDDEPSVITPYQFEPRQETHELTEESEISSDFSSDSESNEGMPNVEEWYGPKIKCFVNPLQLMLFLITYIVC